MEPTTRAGRAGAEEARDLVARMELAMAEERRATRALAVAAAEIALVGPFAAIPLYWAWSYRFAAKRRVDEQELAKARRAAVVAVAATGAAGAAAACACASLVAAFGPAVLGSFS